MASGTFSGFPVLKRIAATLSVPIEHFTNSEALGRWEGISEGLQLLQRIESDAAMRRALEGLRRVVREDGTRISRPVRP